MSRLSRRRLLELGGGVAAGAALGGSAGVAARAAADRADASAALPFDGPGPQQGITTERQGHLALAAFDLADDLRGEFGRGELRSLMRDWSVAARTICAGGSLGGKGGGPAAGLGAPGDTGEASGIGPARLTITFGLGPRLFDTARDLLPADARPTDFAALPPFRGDALRASWSGGDLVVAACADDAQVTIHAIHTLARIARGAANLRWVQRGFVPAAPAGEAPRNLMGFQDGQSMLDHRDERVAGRLLWAGSEAPAWLRGGGTFLVVRRVRIELEAWDSATLEHQEATIGRTRAQGRFLPATGVGRSDYGAARDERSGSEATGARGSHAAVARDAVFASGQILRRPYSYADGLDPATGQLDAGMVFTAFQRSIREQFVPMQQRLATFDALSDYTSAIGSAVFAIPPASRDARDFVGRALLT